MSAEGRAPVSADDDEIANKSSMPVLGEGFSPPTYISSAAPPGQQKLGLTTQEVDVDPKTGKRRFWSFGKKKDEEKAKKRRDAERTQLGGPAIPISPIYASKMMPGSPKAQFASYPYGSPSSPGRLPQEASPHIPSPASSQIFERNVQDEIPLVSASPAIPGHVATENYIPPVLDASTEAITDDHLDPDHVEIVMHAAHQPAAVTVTGSDHGANALQEEPLGRSEPEDTTPSYGVLDANDVRRLSFISFADVVHADKASDHTAMSDSGVGTFSGAPSIGQFASHNRSPSPIRSPLSNQALTGSSPTSEPGSLKGFEGPQASWNTGSSPSGAGLTVETMRQALRKTGSGDLSAARSNPVSAAPGDDATMEHGLK